jgi:hypothetical protein
MTASGTTGNVNIGGIAGFTPPGVIRSCVALNPSITSSNTTKRRIGLSVSSVSNSYARADMLVNNAAESGETAENGTDAALADMQTQTWWTGTAGWTVASSGGSEAAPWVWDNTAKVPRLWFESRRLDGFPQTGNKEVSYTITSDGKTATIIKTGTITGDELKAILGSLDSDTVVLDMSGISSTSDFSSFASSQWPRSLTKMILPDNLTSIGTMFFEGSNCQYLASIEIDSSNTAYETVDGVLYNKGQTKIVRYPPAKTGTSFTPPSTGTSAVTFAFYKAQNLRTVDFSTITTIDGMDCFSYSSIQSITLSSGLTSIPAYTFEESAITSITIPASVTSIGGDAFYNCASLTTITMEGETPPTTTNEYNGHAGPFDSCPNLTAIYVPASAVSAYQTAAVWSVYADLIQALSP